MWGDPGAERPDKDAIHTEIWPVCENICCRVKRNSNYKRNHHYFSDTLPIKGPTWGRAVTNTQRFYRVHRILTQVSRARFKILAASNKASFCRNATSVSALSFSIHITNFFETQPKAPTATGTILALFNLRICAITISKFGIFHIVFPYSFSPTLYDLLV